MNTRRRSAALAAITGLMAIVSAQSQPPMPPPVPPEVLAGLRGVAGEAARNCTYFHDNAKRVSIRSSQQGHALAAINRLKDAAKKFAADTCADRWPRPDWLRVCSENLLDAWMGVDQTFPMLQAPPPVMDWWGRAQASLVALYNAAAPYIGRPAGGPMPMALGGAPGGPPPTGLAPAPGGPVRALPMPPGTVRETVPVAPIVGEPVVR